MNTKRFIIASIVIFIVMEILGYLIHNVLLSSVYKDLSTLWRPDMMSLIWIMYLTGLLFSFFFVYIFIRGYEKKGIWEGVRYGIIVALLMTIPVGLNHYVMYPLPLSLVLEWIGFGIIEMIIYGIIAAAIYRSE